jgi:hypothetical protein
MNSWWSWSWRGKPPFDLTLGFIIRFSAGFFDQQSNGKLRYSGCYENLTSSCRLIRVGVILGDGGQSKFIGKIRSDRRSEFTFDVSRSAE